MAKKKYYAYTVDGKSGIAESWAECEKMVSGKQSARYRGFESREAAQLWLDAGADYAIKHVAAEVGVYFDAGTGAGKGVEINVTDETGNSFVKKLLGHDVTNNFGELQAMQYALEIASQHGIKQIFGDSKLVIEFWSQWRVKKEVDEKTKQLAKKVSLLRKTFENQGGEITLISGGGNPADLGFHK